MRTVIGIVAFALLVFLSSTEAGRDLRNAAFAMPGVQIAFCLVVAALAGRDLLVGLRTGAMRSFVYYGSNGHRTSSPGWFRLHVAVNVFVIVAFLSVAILVVVRASGV